MRIDQLSGDSTVENVRLVDGEARFRFKDYESDQAYDIAIPADRLLSNCQSEEGSVYVRLMPIAEYLNVEEKSGRYIAPADFGKQMEMAREGYGLAIGLKATEYPLLLQVRGYSLLVACPLQSVEQVRLVLVQ